MKRYLTIVVIFFVVSLSAFSQDYWTQSSNDLFNPNILCLEQKEGEIFAGTEYGGVFKSTNNGANWYWVSNGLTNYTIQCLAVCGTNLYAGTRGSGIFMSTNDGDNWIPTYSGLPNGNVTCMESIDNKVFVGLELGGICLTTDCGLNWTPINNNLPINLGIKSIALTGNNIYAATYYGIFLSTNNGGYWSLVDRGMSDKNITSIIAEGSLVIAGSENGFIYLSSNQGSNWVEINNGVPNFEILSIISANNNIFVSTSNSGVYKTTNNGTNWTLINSGLPNTNVTCFTIIGYNIFAGSLNAGVYFHSGFNPYVTTASVSSISNSTAVAGGNITSDGGVSVTARGVVWGTSANPAIESNLGITIDGTGTGSFTSSITSLTPNTMYHVRAYATNSVGTSYGEDLTFTTLVSNCSIVTQSVSSILAHTATANGEITNIGGENASRRGFCFNTTGNPTVSDSKVVENGSFGTGTFSLQISNLLSNTQYYVKAFAENSGGLSYGNEVSFKTLDDANFSKLSFQGQLTDFNGNNLPDGQYPILFRLYTELSGQGVPVWQEQQMVILNNGILSVILGSVVPIDLPFNTSYFLGISVSGQEELSPRFPLVGPVYQNGGFGR